MPESQNLINPQTLEILFWTLLIWSTIWKGFALWISAKENKMYWFVPILVLNTLGILEIIYIFAVSKVGKNYFKKQKKNLLHKFKNTKHTEKEEKHIQDTE
jgi:hypothetical protein